MKNELEWETGYDFDFVIPSLVEKYKQEHFNYITNEIRRIKSIDIESLQKSLAEDHEYMHSCPSSIIRLFFDGNKEKFIQEEAYGYSYIKHILDSAMKSIRENVKLSSADECFIRGLSFRQVTSVYNRAWYFLKRINFSKETLSQILPKFAKILYCEDYISTDKNFTRLEIINVRNPSMNVEDIINNDYLNYDFYYADKKLLTGISEEIGNKQIFEEADFQTMLKQVLEGKILLCIFK